MCRSLLIESEAWLKQQRETWRGLVSRNYVCAPAYRTTKKPRRKMAGVNLFEKFALSEQQYYLVIVELLVLELLIVSAPI